LHSNRHISLQKRRIVIKPFWEFFQLIGASWGRNLIFFMVTSANWNFKLFKHFKFWRNLKKDLKITKNYIKLWKLKWIKCRKIKIDKKFQLTNFYAKKTTFSSILIFLHLIHFNILYKIFLKDI
jgi:hypothetical protein